jgi:hypothetical protein
MRQIGLLMILAFVFVSCTKTTSTQSDLQGLNLKGDVVKLEVITQTTIPVSEWFSSGIDFSDYSISYRKDAVYTFVGNSSMAFDENGRLSSINVYDNEGNIIFKDLPDRSMQLSLYQPINIKVNELSDGWNFEFDDSLRVVRQTTSHEGKLFLDRQVSYNEKGDIDYVICNYSGLKMSWGYEPADTTFFVYNKYDSIGNWIEATIEHRGNLRTDSYQMNVRRQFTYKGEPDKTPLIEKLAAWNEGLKENAQLDTIYSIMVNKKLFNNSIELQMPEKLEVDIAHNVPNSLLYQLPNANGFFNVSVTKENANGDIFEEEPSQDVYNALSYAFGSNGTVVLKWYDFSNKGIINDNKCVTMEYAFYATGGYLNTGDPIITEIIEFQPNSDTVYSIAIGYDSYHKNIYKPWAERIKNSIVINNF